MFDSVKRKATALLRWSERYTKTDMVYLASGGFWLVLGYVGQMIMGLLLAIALAKLLPKEVYGTYQFIISTCAIIGGFTLTGMGTALMRSIARGEQGTLRYAFKKQLLWSIGIVLAGSATAIYYLLKGNFELATAFFLCGAIIPFLSGFSLYRPFLEGKQLFRESTTIGLWRRPLPVIAMVVAILLTKDPIILVVTYFASQAISMGLLYWLTIKKYPEPVVENPEVLSYSKHLSVMSFVGLITNNVDNILVFHYLGAAPLAVYALAQIPFAQINKMFGLLSNLVFPKFAQRDFKLLRQTIFHKVLFYFFITILVVISYIIAAPYIFKVLFPNYPEAVLFSQILMLALLVKPAALYAQVFAAHGMTRIQHFMQYSTGALKLTLLVILLPIYGLWGAVYAILIMNVYWTVSLAILFYRRTA